jgi:hypothetical protein
MDVTSSSTNWIFAAKSGSAINSDSTSATITQHSNTYGTMTLDLTKAVDSANTNPFTNSTTASTGSTGSTSGSDCDTSGGSSSSNGGATPTSSSGGGFFGGFGPTGDGSFTPPWATGSSNKRAAATNSACPSSSGSTSHGGVNQLGSLNIDTQNMMIKAHAIMACLAFAILFPFGAISIRLLSFPGLVLVHALFQIFAYLIYIIAFGLGVYLATQMRLVSFVYKQVYKCKTDIPNRSIPITQSSAYSSSFSLPSSQFSAPFTIPTSRSSKHVLLFRMPISGLAES